MTLLEREEFWNQLPIAELEWRLATQQETSSLGGGDVLRADVGPSLWEATVACAPMAEATARTVRTLLMRLERPDAAFLAYDLHAPYPAGDPGGDVLRAHGGGFPRGDINAIDLGGSRIAIGDLPVGYELTAGDYVEIRYGSPLRYGLHRLTEGAVAVASGAAPFVKIVPELRVGVSLGDAARLGRPGCKCVLVPGSVSYGAMRSGLIRGVGFTLRQTLR